MSQDAYAVFEALACGRSGCRCAAAVRRGQGATHCPAHDDRHPSLSVTVSGGKLLWNCHAGCPQEAVLGALRDRGLMHEVQDRNGHRIAWHERKGRWLQPDGTLGLNGASPADMLYGLELLNKHPDLPVILVEGEKAALALRALHPLTLGTFGRGVIPSRAVLRNLAGRRVMLWPDNDPDGGSRKAMETTAGECCAVGVERIDIATWPDAPEKGDAADFVAQGLNSTADLALESWTCEESEGSEVSDGEEPNLSSHNSLSSPPWPLLGEAALYGLAGDFVRAMDPHTEADPAAILFQLLVGFGNLIGRGPYVVAEADHHYTNLFVVLVGNTSKARKGSSWGRVRRALADVDLAWGSTRIAHGLSSGEGLTDEVKDPVYKDTDDGPKLIEPGVIDKRLLVFEAEFSSVLKQASREKNILSAVLRQAWDDGDLRSLTVQSKRRATGAHISIVGHITRTELLRQITETDAANGFGNRFLWVCARRSKVLPRGGGDPNLSEVGPGLAEAATHARRVRQLERDYDADLLWDQVYGPLSSGGESLLDAMTARAEAQVMRLAEVYALLQRQEVIARVHLEAALAAWKYAEDSARYIFGDQLGDPTADTILAALRQHREGLSRQQISVDVFGRHKSSDEISRALGRLLSQGLVAQEVVQTKGRPAEIWKAL